MHTDKTSLYFSSPGFLLTSVEKKKKIIFFHNSAGYCVNARKKNLKIPGNHVPMLQHLNPKEISRICSISFFKGHFEKSWEEISLRAL